MAHVAQLDEAGALALPGVAALMSKREVLEKT
jgi:hypothetical protein